MFPVPEAAPQLEPLLAVQFQFGERNAGWNVSVTVALMAGLGPLLVTTIVHVSGVPAMDRGCVSASWSAPGPPRTRTRCGRAPLSLAAFGSSGTLACRLAVLSIVPPCVTVAVIVRIAVRVCGSGPTVQSPFVWS